MSTPKQHITMLNRRMNGKSRNSAFPLLVHSANSYIVYSPIKRNVEALDTVNNNMYEQHHQMRAELQDRHTDVVNNVNEYTACA